MEQTRTEIKYVRMTPQQREKIEAFGETLGLSFSETLRLIIADWINRTYSKTNEIEAVQPEAQP